MTLDVSPGNPGWVLLENLSRKTAARFSCPGLISDQTYAIILCQTSDQNFKSRAVGPGPNLSLIRTHRVNPFLPRDLFLKTYFTRLQNFKKSPSWDFGSLERPQFNFPIKEDQSHTLYLFTGNAVLKTNLPGKGLT